MASKPSPEEADGRADAGGLLVNGSGHPVLGQNGTINVPVGLELNIAPDGTIYSTDPTEPVAEAIEVDRLMLRDASETQPQAGGCVIKTY